MLLQAILLSSLSFTAAAGDIAGSGDDCKIVDCANNGTCIEGSGCLCAEGFSGPYCETYKKIYSDYRLNMQYTFVQKRVNFQGAVEECLNLSGRLIFNISDSRVQTGLGRMWTDLRYRDPKFNDYENEVFWGIAGDYPNSYPDNLPNSIGGNCSASNARGLVQAFPCNTTYLTVMCATPLTGSCYSEVRKKMCYPPTEFCRYGYEGIEAHTCHCRTGFRFIEQNASCIDENECDRSRCERPTVCKNTIGSYYCGCESGKQGNGIDTCGYVLTLTQQNIDFTVQGGAAALIDPRSSSTVPYTITPATINIQSAKQELENKLVAVYRIATKSIDKIVVKTIDASSPNNATAQYDVYVQDPSISPTSLLEFYREVARQNKLYWLKGSTPSVPASLFCTPSGLGFGYGVYNFSNVQAGETALSSQKCPNGRSIATAVCKVKQNHDGSYTAYFDLKTARTVPCELSLTDVKDEVSHIHSPDTAEVALADLDLLTADYTKSDDVTLRQATDTLKNVAEYVMDFNAEINVDTMVSMMSVANNINRALKYDQITGGNSLLDSVQKQDIVASLEKCSTHVQVMPSETLTIASDFATMEVTNALPMNSSTSSSTGSAGIFFETHGVAIDSLLGSPDCVQLHPTKLQAFINQDIVAKAGKMKSKSSMNLTSLPVSFMHFADSEFFTTKSDKYEIEQVLSARISNLELNGLKNPIWFQMQHTSLPNKYETKYYKCAYLNEETLEWLPDGCSIVPGSDPPNCTCDHMTNFAILVQTHPRLRDYSLEVFGTVLCSISVIGLCLMLFIHLFFPSLRKSQVVKIHCHLAFCLLISYIILLTSTERPKPHGSCIATAAFLHFFLLSSWGWMLVECFTMYKKLVNVFSSPASHYVTKAAGAVYVVSACAALATVVGAVVGYDSANYGGWTTSGSDFVPSSYVSDRLCWLHGYSLIFGFLVPIGIAFIVNLIGSVLILRAISWGRRKDQVRSSAKDRPNVRSYLIRAMTISVLLGLSWIFAIPLTVTDDPIVNAIFGWLFSITNALQGLFIFILFCVMREDVRKLWWNELLRFFKDQRRGTASQQFSTSDSARAGTREISHDASSSDTSHDASVTATTKLSQSYATITMDTIKEDVQETSSNKREDHFQLGAVSSFHPMGKE